jgi:diaminopimelate decarboxylase
VYDSVVNDVSQRAPTWWIRPGLEVRDGRLCIAGRDAEAVAREHGTPLYVHDLTHIEEQVRAVQGALARTGLGFRVRLALKSQRQPEILARVRGLGAPGTPDGVGLDVCSPGEVEWALAHGWHAEELSYTGTNVSDADFGVILRHPLQLNVDLLSQLERVGRLAPGRKIGLRINPRTGATRPYVPVGFTSDEEAGFGQYASAKPTKFGVYAEQLDDAVAIARKHGLRINCVVFHICHQMLTDELPKLDHALSEAAGMIDHLRAAGCPIEEINSGGGLGTPLREGDEPLDLDAWAGLLARHLGPFGVTVATEPGEFFVSRAGVMLAEVVTVEDRMGTTFVGLNAGWNIMAHRFVWRESVEIVPAAEPLAPRPRRVTIAGHINEAPDLFAEDYPFPTVREGDIVAVMNVGSYCQAVVNQHCLRPPAKAVFLEDRL